MLSYTITTAEWNRALLITLLNPTGSAFADHCQSHSYLLPGTIVWDVEGQPPFELPHPNTRTAPETVLDSFRLRILDLATQCANFLARGSYLRSDATLFQDSESSFAIRFARDGDAVRLDAGTHWRGELRLDQFLHDIQDFLGAFCTDVAQFAPAILTYECDALLRLHIPTIARTWGPMPLYALAPDDSGADGFHWDRRAADWEKAALSVRKNPPNSLYDEIGTVRYSFIRTPVHVLRDGRNLVFRGPLLERDARHGSNGERRSTGGTPPRERSDPSTTPWPIFDLACQLAERLYGDGADELHAGYFDHGTVWFGLRQRATLNAPKPHIRRGLLDEIEAELGEVRFAEAGHALIMSFLRAVSFHLPAASTWRSFDILCRYLARRTP